MTTEDSPDDGRPDDHEALETIRKQARGARKQFRREIIRAGEASDDSKLKLAEAALDYRDVLIDYRGDGVYRPPWGERDVDLDWITDIMDRRVSVEEEASGLGHGTETTGMPAYAALSGEELYKLTKEFDSMWRELGLGLPTEEREGPGGVIPDASETDRVEQ